MSAERSTPIKPDARDIRERQYTENFRDWYIEVCAICGCQLGPGIGSRTQTGRCVVEAHRQTGGIVVRVVARPIEQQREKSTRRYMGRRPESFPTA